MRIIKTTLLLICILFSLSTLSAQPNATEWKTFTATEYELQYPSDWELDTSKQMGTVFILLSPANTKKDVQFRENINLVQQTLMDAGMLLEELVALSEKQILTMITDSEITSSNKISSPQGDYQQVQFTGRQGQHNLVFEQRYWIVGTTAYVLTLTCTTETEGTIKENGLKVLNNFSFL